MEVEEVEFHTPGGTRQGPVGILNPGIDQFVTGASTVAIALGLWAIGRQHRVPAVGTDMTTQANPAWVSPTSSIEVPGLGLQAQTEVSEWEVLEEVRVDMPPRNQQEVLLHVTHAGRLSPPASLSEAEVMEDYS